MKQIKDKAYYDLTVSERIIASIEASARKDKNEIQKLIKTCPMKSYKATDSDYSDRMEFLLSMLIAIEHDLTQNALDYAIGTFGMSEVSIEKANIIEETALQSMSNILTSWHRFIEDKGIPVQTIETLTEQFRHPFVGNLLPQIKQIPPNQEKVNELKDLIEQGYKGKG